MIISYSTISVTLIYLHCKKKKSSSKFDYSSVTAQTTAESCNKGQEVY